jgi:hypothetical protein
VKSVLVPFINIDLPFGKLFGQTELERKGLHIMNTPLRQDQAIKKSIVHGAGGMRQGVCRQSGLLTFGPTRYALCPLCFTCWSFQSEIRNLNSQIEEPVTETIDE